MEPRPPRRLKTVQSDPVRRFLPFSSADDDPPLLISAGDSASSRYRWRYTAVGVLLALGAPGGALIMRTSLGETHSIIRELSANSFFYLYTLIGTAIVFGAAGFLAGYQADVIAQARDRFHHMAEHDALTGLYNSGAFWERYRRAIEKATRLREPISLLVLDLDRLKELNDKEGHRFGNAALIRVSDCVTDTKRADDIAARWGGDEFVILMPGAPAAAANRVAEKLLECVRSTPLRTSRTERTISVTIGVAAAAAGENPQGLFDRADAALYAGKRRGGDQCFLVEDETRTGDAP